MKRIDLESEINRNDLQAKLFIFLKDNRNIHLLSVDEQDRIANNFVCQNFITYKNLSAKIISDHLLAYAYGIEKSAFNQMLK